MKYIRTKDGVYNTSNMKWCECSKQASYYKDKNYILYVPLKQADTIEELCDAIAIVWKDCLPSIWNNITHIKDFISTVYSSYQIKHKVVGVYGAIFTDKGLIYVAKMNEKGDLELL